MYTRTICRNYHMRGKNWDVLFITKTQIYSVYINTYPSDIHIDSAGLETLPYEPLNLHDICDFSYFLFALTL
jgi:hypothetical protein